jgi:hypothetical protein
VIVQYELENGSTLFDPYPWKQQQHAI